MESAFIMVTRVKNHIEVEAFSSYEKAERRAEHLISLWIEAELRPVPRIPNWNGEDYCVWDELEQLKSVTSDSYDLIIENTTIE